MSLMEALEVAALLVSGMGVALLGSVKLALARKLQMDEARVGGLVSVFGLALIPAFPLAGSLADAVGKQPVLMAGCVGVAASLVVLGTARAYPVAVLGVLILSGAWSGLISVVNPLAVTVFGKPEAYAMNLACFYFGVGALLTPLAVAFLLRRLSLAGALLLLAVVALVPVALALGVGHGALAPPAAPEAAEGVEAPGILSLLKSPFMWLCILAFLFYGPLEAATGAWTSTYLRDSGFRESTASSLLSVFWATYTASRLVTALAVQAADLTARNQSVLILAFGAAAVAALCGIVWSRGRGMALALVIAAGIIFGPIFPTIMAVLLGHFPESVHGRAVGLLFGIGGIGTVTIPAAMGAYAKRTSVQRGFLIAVGSAVALTVTALVLTLRS